MPTLILKQKKEVDSPGYTKQKNNYVGRQNSQKVYVQRSFKPPE